MPAIVKQNPLPPRFPPHCRALASSTSQTGDDPTPAADPSGQAAGPSDWWAVASVWNPDAPESSPNPAQEWRPECWIPLPEQTLPGAAPLLHSSTKRPKAEKPATERCARMKSYADGRRKSAVCQHAAGSLSKRHNYQFSGFVSVTY